MEQNKGLARPKIVMHPPGALKHPETNVRSMSDADMDYLRNSIRTFGFKGVVLVDRNHIIIDGAKMAKAAELEQLQEIPCVVVDDLTPEQVRALRLALNKIAELSVWESEDLRQELKELQGLGFSPESIGFSKYDIEKLFAECEDIITENTSGEIDLDEYEDGQFKHKCPRCGFLYN